MLRKKVNINSRLIFGLFLLFVVSAMLSGFVVFRLSKLTNITNDILRHPYTVSNSVIDIKLNIYAMYQTMEDVAMANNENQFNDALFKVDNYEDTIYSKFDIVFERYLGDPEDVEAAFVLFQSWEPIRNEVIAFVKEGKQQQAINFTKEKESDYIDELLKKTDVMINFANKKAKEFNNNSIQVLRRSYLVFIIAQLILMIIFFLIALWIYYSINNPLKYLINRIKNIGAKSFNTEISENSTNKITILNAAIDELEKHSKLLTEEIDQRKTAQKKVEDYKTNLEEKVEQRTEELEKSNAEAKLLAKMLNESSQAFAVGKPDGSLNRINDAFCNLTGYSRNELLKNIKWNDTLTPDEYHELENEKINSLSQTGIAQRYSKEYIKKDGSRIIVELLINQILDINGNMEYLYGFITDITELKNKESELKKYRTQLEDQVKKRTEELENKNDELELFNNLFVGREFRIKELKTTIELLKKEIEKLKNNSK